MLRTYQSSGHEFYQKHDYLWADIAVNIIKNVNFFFIFIWLMMHHTDEKTILKFRKLIEKYNLIVMRYTVLPLQQKINLMLTSHQICYGKMMD